MPFTPFHLGPGALFKAIGGERFSFLIFGGSQVLMDGEPLVRIMRGDAILHGVTHTVAGALGIAIVSAVAGLPTSNRLLRHWGYSPISWPVALISALIGTYSHILLDGVMHADMRPLWPLAQGNALLGVISIRALHLLCVGSGVLGGVIVAKRTLRDA